MKRIANSSTHQHQLFPRRLSIESLEGRCLLAGDLHLLKDINAHGNGSSPQRIFSVGDVAYFSATTNDAGTELWKSDGTPDGTLLVKDIWPGNRSSIQGNQPGAFGYANGQFYFPANDGAFGTELWKTDGTPDGTMLVRDINPSGSSSPFELITVGNTVFFFADDGQHGRELFRSDGTQPGTGLVKDIAVGSTGSNPSGLVYAGGLLYFFADDGIRGKELWKSDGSPEGTTIVKDIRPNGASIVNGSPFKVGDQVFFSADDGIHGAELWFSDGTTVGTFMVSEIRPGLAGSSPVDFANFNGILFFRANDSIYGTEVWKSDGTYAGTQLLKDIAVGGSALPNNLTIFNGILFFNATSATGQELWKSDGSPGGTVLVKDIRPGFEGSNPTRFKAIGNTLYFSADDGAHGHELWKSDGTAEGTQLVADIWPGSNASTSYTLENVNGVLFFNADDGGSSGRELWRSDGTSAGTYVVKDIAPSTESSTPSNLVSVGGKLYFAATDGSGGKLWTSDGTAAGTVVYNDVQAGSFVGGAIYSMNGKLFYNANDGIHGTGLWGDRTRITFDYYDDRQGIDGSGLASVGNSVFFIGPFYGNYVTNLWITDGSGAGPITTTYGPAPILGYIGLSNLTNLNGKLVFSGQSTDAKGHELLHIDSLHATIKDIKPGLDGSNPQNLTVLGTKLLLTADDGVHGIELWKSDGTEAGTVLVKDIVPGASHSSPAQLTAVNGVVFFTLTNDEGLRRLWRSDGTEEGTYLVTTDDSVTSIANLTNIGGRLYFTASDPLHGNELWTSNGTAAGTYLVKDIRPGTSGSQIKYLTDVLGTAYFSADDGVHGAELWSSNGSADGTLLEYDLTGDARGSNPRQITEAGGRLYVVATTDAYGQEIYVDSVAPRGRMVFYNKSKWDGNNSAVAANDDQAISSKTALLPGRTATSSNYTNYSRGINGIMVDLETSGVPTLADFQFKVGNDSSLLGWLPAPNPQSFAVRTAPGVFGYKRVTITWPDKAILGKWLQVTVKATAATGLLQDDVFYFGNAPGETGNSATNALVNAADEIDTRNHPTTFADVQSLANAYDFNRDGLVNAIDQIIARSNQTTLATALQLIQPPAALSLHADALLDETPYDFLVVAQQQLAPLVLPDERETRARESVSLGLALLRSQTSLPIGPTAAGTGNDIGFTAAACDACLATWIARPAAGQWLESREPLYSLRRNRSQPNEAAIALETEIAVGSPTSAPTSSSWPAAKPTDGCITFSSKRRPETQGPVGR